MVKYFCKWQIFHCLTSFDWGWRSSIQPIDELQPVGNNLKCITIYKSLNLLFGASSFQVRTVHVFHVSLIVSCTTYAFKYCTSTDQGRFLPWLRVQYIFNSIYIYIHKYYTHHQLSHIFIFFSGITQVWSKSIGFSVKHFAVSSGFHGSAASQQWQQALDAANFHHRENLGGFFNSHSGEFQNLWMNLNLT